MIEKEAVVQRGSVKMVFLEISQNSHENTCARVAFLIKLQACNFIKKETLAQVFSCEFCEISKDTFLQRTPLVAASIKNATFPQITVLSDANVSKNRMGENKIGEITENGVVPVIALFF